MKNKAVFLDRDGTIIVDNVYLNDPSLIEIYPQSAPAIRLLNHSGFLVFIVTNQSGVARGLVKEDNVKVINLKLATDLQKQGAIISDARYCPHAPDEGCACRKPQPGMIVELAKKYDVDLSASWMVGDRLSDVQAGEAAGCRGVLIQNEATLHQDAAEVDYIVSHIGEAVTIILSQSKARPKFNRSQSR